MPLPFDPSRPVDRRTVLRTGGALALGLLGCRPAPVPPGPPLRARTLAPVHVSPERVLRTVVGLRPHRRHGFRVEAERRGSRLLVHNYGHGGSGVTLSWGTAHLAVEHLEGMEVRRAAVVGCGVVGLSTARLLQRRGIAVTVYARELPPHTTSDVAGATWYPSGVASPRERTPALEARFERAARLSHREFAEMDGARYGIRTVEQYWLSEAPFEWFWERRVLADLYGELEVLPPGAHPFAAAHVQRDRTFLIEPPVYLPALVEDVRAAGGRIERRAFASADEMLSLPEPVIFNCTGLSSGALFADPGVIPIRGQLTLLRPQPEVDYVMGADDVYMFSRRDAVVLGGTFEPDAWDLAPDPAAEARILARHAELFGAMRRT